MRFFLACIITVAVETAFFWLAGCRRRLDLEIVALANVVTNLTLNLLLALVPALYAVGYAVTVYDSRPALADPARWPQAERVLCGPFEEAFSGLEIGPADSIVVMTPGHRADYQVLRQALRTPAGYIGCIGSAKKVAYVNGCLKADGFSEAEIGRIHSPIGLPILAQTPEEIAVSITAQLILHRHGGL